MNLSEAKHYVKWNSMCLTPLCSGRFVYAEVKCWYQGKVITGEGMARCSNDDEFDFNKGVEIARGRAVADAARKLASHVNGPPISWDTYSNPLLWHTVSAS